MRRKATTRGTCSRAETRPATSRVGAGAASTPVWAEVVAGFAGEGGGGSAGGGGAGGGGGGGGGAGRGRGGTRRGRRGSRAPPPPGSARRRRGPGCGAGRAARRGL